MKKVLSFLKHRMWGIAFLFLVVGINLAMARQGAALPVNVNAGFDAVLLIPLFVGILAHYLKSYSRGQTTQNLWQYLSQGFGTTFTTFIGSVGILIGMIAASPASYSPITFGVLFNVFLIGFSADSAVGGPAIKLTASVAAPKPPTP